jgi:hypothetical protein
MAERNFQQPFSHGGTEGTEERQKTEIWFWRFLREQLAVGDFDLAFLSVPPCLRERMAVRLFGCSSASPRSLRLREKAVGYFFGSGSVGLGSLCFSRHAVLKTSYEKMSQKSPGTVFRGFL